MPLTGALAESFGWETVFYVFGGIGAFWFIIWCFLIKGNHFVVEVKDEEAIKEKGIKHYNIDCVQNIGSAFEIFLKPSVIFVYIITTSIFRHEKEGFAISSLEAHICYTSIFSSNCGALWPIVGLHYPYDRDTFVP